MHYVVRPGKDVRDEGATYLLDDPETTHQHNLPLELSGQDETQKMRFEKSFERNKSDLSTHPKVKLVQNETRERYNKSIFGHHFLLEDGIWLE